MRNACDSDSRCGLACDASARNANVGGAMQTTKGLILATFANYAKVQGQNRAPSLLEPRVFV